MDEPNVDFVVHIGYLPFPEEKVQEFGRTGQDDHKANGI